MRARPYLAWRWRKLRRRLVRSVASRLYRDTERDLRKSVMIAGTGRSGTTWLADLIRSQASCRIMFEPFNSNLVDAYRQFNYFQYMRPGEENPALFDYCERIFSGDIRHRWIDRQVDVLRPGFRLIKEIRANLFLGWMHERFPAVPLLFLIRHPCAVVLSRLELGWATDQDIAPCLSQPKLVSDFLRDKVEVIRQSQTAEEKHAVIWCLHHLVPLEQLQRGGVSTFFYENLCLQPEVEVPRIFQAVGRSYREAIFASLRRPSSTATRASAAVAGGDLVARWQNELSPAQIGRILSVVKRFELDHLYGDSEKPLQEAP